MTYNWIVTMLLFPLSTGAQIEQRSVPYEELLNEREAGDTTTHIHFQFQLQDGRMSGPFAAYYWSGQTKAIGILENGQPKGEWKVFYEDGRLAIKRFYHHPAEFETIFPPLPKKGPANLFGRNTNQPFKRDSSGVIQFRPLRETDLYWEQWVRRWIPATEQNRVMFKNNQIWNTIWAAVRSDELPVYSAIESKMKTRLSKEDIQAIQQEPLQLLGLETKEAHFFSKSGMSMEARFIGLRPVFWDKIKQDTVRLFWIYYPQARKFLASVKLNQPGLPAEIQSLDDVFYFRHFSGTIYQKHTVYDQGSPTYYFEDRTIFSPEAERIELGILETDFEFWAHFNAKAYKKQK